MTHPRLSWNNGRDLQRGMSIGLIVMWLSTFTPLLTEVISSPPCMLGLGKGLEQCNVLAFEPRIYSSLCEKNPSKKAKEADAAWGSRQSRGTPGFACLYSGRRHGTNNEDEARRLITRLLPWLWQCYTRSSHRFAII